MPRRRPGTVVRRASHERAAASQPAPAPGGFVPPWLLGVAIVGAGCVAHVVWGQDVQVATTVASALTLITVGLCVLTWQYATPRRRLTPRQKLVRLHATGTVAVSGGQALALLAYGFTRGTLTAVGMISFTVAVSWNIPRFQAIRDVGLTDHTDDGTAAALGLEGASARLVHEDDDKVITVVQPALGQSHRDIQRIAEPLATATHAPVGGVRVTVNPKDAGKITVTRMKRDVLEGVHSLPDLSHTVGLSLADAPILIGPREDNEVADFWFPGEGTRAASHLLIMGVSGSGKGETYRAMTVQAMVRCDTLSWLVDIAKPWQTARSIDGGLDLLATNLPEAAAVMTGLRRLITYRSKKLGEAGYDQWEKGCPSPAVVVNLEEAAAIFAADGEWVDDFTRICEQARSVGVFLVVSMQRASADNMPTSVRYNLGAGMCFGVRASVDATMCLSPETIDAGASPTWSNRNVGVCYLEAPGVDPEDWSMKVKGYLASADHLEALVDAGRAVRCPGLPADEAAVMGDIYTRLHRDHTSTKEVAVPDDNVPDTPDEEDDMDEGPPPTHPEDVDIDPTKPIPPFNPAEDDPNGMRFATRTYDPRQMTLDEERREFANMLQDLAGEGVTLVDYKILMERWPYRSQPTINRRMRELEDAGQVRRVSTRKFQAAKWQIVALVTSVSA